MTFRDFQEAVNRLASDPRVHPSTRVEIAYCYEIPAHIEHDDDDEDGTNYLSVPEETLEESSPVVSIVLNGCITLSTERVAAAVAR